jgi:hypothetical protein
MIAEHILDLTSLRNKWTAGEELTAAEAALLEQNYKENADVRVRESCRVLISATQGKADGEPHVQRLLQKRNLELLKAKIVMVPARII